MKLLALDTATENCSAALLIDEVLLGREQLAARTHAELILPMISGLLAQASLGLSALDAIAFGCGPGAFTGVRLAASLTQGLAFGAALPVIPVSDLAAVAQRALDADPTLQRVLVCNDARMQEVYWGCFARGARQLARRVGEERVTAAAHVQLPPGWESGALGAAGSGLAAYPELGARLKLDAARLRPHLLPRAHEIVRLAVPEWQEGRTLPAGRALPVYLRNEVVRPA
ncbi:MAG: tRNA (adenosine(37)-N6)-threonylcarbamoyltransferase complex dimerization subunit type 1 TsaB [Gammaproteobacteria bacterium]|nr:tRNA (adenosine(37)-N6)-threonylcarbamoyltransferase complex dimerization subunit type 1 TsaB [Gammaproteobacteria bacterium]